MESKNLSNAIAALAPGAGFTITGDVTNATEYDSGVYFEDPTLKPTWSAVEPEITVAQWGLVREARDNRLLKCDWTQLVDVPLTEAQKTAWQTYRTALRDITTQSDPFNINWPSPPE
tara:strand:- start:229 stop:579 length:351 start_codon:yes stop_codon:yes gene_type:complete